MSQGSVTIESEKTLKLSLPDINAAFQILLSNSSGTSFPIDDLVIGMTCYRTDQQKLYRLLNLDPTWHLEFDFAKTFGAADSSLTADKATALNANPSDTSTVATMPNDYNGVLKFVGIKTATAINLTAIDNIDGATLSFVCGVRGAADSTGGVAHELAFCSNGKMYQRYGSTTAWGSWIRLASKADVDAIVTTLTNAMSLLAPKDTPIFTGIPKAPTAANGTNTEQIATTKFVKNAVYDDRELPGIVKFYAGSSAPSGYFLCQGQAVSRITYADLYAVIGTTYGAGDGSTTFNVPDLRGLFVRGVGGNSAALGAVQGDAIRNITGGFYSRAEMNSGSGAIDAESGYFGQYQLQNGSNAQGHVTFDASRQVPTANENRPVNMAMNYIIKY